MSLFQVNNLNIGFQQAQTIKPVVTDVNFSVNRGETLSLIGESGSGKTLTALAIMRLLPVSAHIYGTTSICLDNQNLLELSERQMRSVRGKRISMIFQEPMTSLNPVLTIGEQVSEVLHQHTKLHHAEIREKIIELFIAVGLPDPKLQINRYPHQLSGGMKQRIMIAMAIALEPDLLIADEPTSALDVTIQKQILELLKALQKKMGMAILLVTHDLGVVKFVADKVAVMYQGTLVEQALCTEFFAKPQHPYSQELFASLPSFEKRILSNHTNPSKKIVLNLKDVCMYFPVQKGIFKRTVSYIKAVDGVSLRLQQGKTLAIVGESGSGKTTLAKGILQLLPKNSGEITINGNIKHKTKDLRRCAQIIFQDPFSSMNPRMLVGDIIAEGMRALKIGDKIIQQQRIQSLIEQVGLPMDSAVRYPHEFSGGQRQRICIARALAVEPEIILCDEPTSALDLLVQDQILKLLKRLQREKNLSYLFITHNIGVVSYIADEIAVMFQGKIVEQGETQQILQNPQHPYTKQLLAAVLS